MAEKEEPETTETPETENPNDDNESTSWEKMRSLVDDVVGKRLSEWRPAEHNSSSESTPEKKPDPTPKTPERKPERKKGFLSDFFRGLE